MKKKTATKAPSTSQTLTERKIQFLKDNASKGKDKCRAMFCTEFYGDRSDGIPEQKFGYLWKAFIKG